jgi:hypothetical protein
MRITSTLLLTAALAIGAALPAAAGTWDAVYGATIVSTYADGHVVKVYVNADHTYSIALPDGKTLKGTWADGSGGSCFTLDSGGAPVCFALKDYHVGDTFTGTDATGSFTGVITAGR